MIPGFFFFFFLFLGFFSIGLRFYSFPKFSNFQKNESSEKWCVLIIIDLLVSNEKLENYLKKEMGHDRDKNDPRVISKLKQNILQGNQSLSENGKYREDVESIVEFIFISK